MFQQEQAGHIFNLLYQGNRTPYHWTDANKPFLIRFKPYSGQAAFCPSFTLTDVGQITVSCLNKGTQKLFFRVTKRTSNATVFCVIEDSETPPYLIKNNLASINLEVRQAGVNNNEFVKMCRLLEFAWANFELQEPLLEVEFYDAKAERSSGIVKQFSLDDLHNVKMLTLAMDKSPSVCVFVSTYRESDVKVIEFGHGPANQVSDVEIEQIEESKSGWLKVNRVQSDTKQSLHLGITQISISCISSCCEVVCVVLHDF